MFDVSVDTKKAWSAVRLGASQSTRRLLSNSVMHTSLHSHPRLSHNLAHHWHLATTAHATLSTFVIILIPGLNIRRMLVPYYALYQKCPIMHARILGTTPVYRRASTTHCSAEMVPRIFKIWSLLLPTCSFVHLIQWMTVFRLKLTMLGHSIPQCPLCFVSTPPWVCIY